jgi:SAM-dependent methyltransferase
MASLLPQVTLPILGTYNQPSTPLLDKPLWFSVSLIDGRFEIEVELECGEKIGPNQTLLQFQFINDSADYTSCGISKSHREEVGYYTYLQTQPGRYKQNISFNIPGNSYQLLVGIRSWCSADKVNLLKLSEPNRAVTSDDNSEITILLSVDVEALPGRAPDNHVDRLIWGGPHGDAGHGVGRLAKVFNDRDAKATFYIDFAACCLHGDQGIFEAAQYLINNDQDVQLHVHSEVLVRNQQWVHASNAIPTFALHSFSTARRAIEYAAEKYKKALGKQPDIFRAGGLWWTTDSILATTAAGIPAASNVSPSRLFTPSSDLFQWENGLIELPVDFCLDPYIQNGCGSLIGDVRAILANKTHKFISCYLHSWSLSPRTQEGFHLDHSQIYQNNLEQAISLLKSIGSLSTSSAEYIQKVQGKKRLLQVPLTSSDSPLNVKVQPNTLPVGHCVCNICGTYLLKDKLKNDVCPYCRLRTRHRILKSVLDRQLGDVFEGKRIIANHADPSEGKVFFANAGKVVNFDVRPLDYLDVVADVHDLSQFADGQFDVFYSIYVLNHVTDDSKALMEMRRVIADNGLAIIMVPFHVNAKTRLHSDITQNYGKDALEKYGVGSYRYYGIADLIKLLSSFFSVSQYFGVDPVTNNQDAVFVCKNHDVGK